jgi:hypothetical protein
VEPTSPTRLTIPGSIDAVTDVTDVSDDELRELMESPPQLDSLHRVWVTPSDRKRCTYVTRDEQPAADSHDNRLLRF